jgi:hypothetical protein
VISKIDTLQLYQTNKQTGCSNTMLLPVVISSQYSPDPTKIKRKENSDILVCEDQQEGLNYQWGYLEKQSGLHQDIQDAFLQYVKLPFMFDTTNHVYYVKTSLDNCSTISYYNYEPLPLSFKKIFKPEIELFPNPTLGYLKLKSKEKIDDIILMDLQGKLVRFTYDQLDIRTYNIYFDELAPCGLYFIKIFVSDDVITKKIFLTK